MSIVFGKNHFILKSYTLEELEISKEISPIRIVKIQRYFHLYWIPFFPIGKEWAIRREGKLYEVPQEYIYILNKKKLVHKTPFYAYSLPLILLFGAILYFSATEIQQYTSSKRAQSNFKVQTEQSSTHLKTPSLNDFYEIRPTSSYSGDTFLKVVSYNDSAIQFQVPNKKIEGYNKNAGYIASCFSSPADEYECFWLSKKTIDSLIKKEYGYQKNKGAEIPFLSFDDTYVLKKIHHFQGPDIKDTGEGKSYQNRISIILKNKGLETNITSIKNIAGDVQWNLSLPLKLSPNKKFELRGSYSDLPIYTLEITCTSQDKSEYKYLITGKGIDRRIKRITVQ